MCYQISIYCTIVKYRLRTYVVSMSCTYNNKSTKLCALNFYLCFSGIYLFFIMNKKKRLALSAYLRQNRKERKKKCSRTF